MARRRRPRPNPPPRPYDPFGQWRMSEAQMRQQAARNAQDQIAALLGALPTSASLKDRQRNESRGIDALTQTAGRLMQNGVNQFSQTAQGVGGAFNQAAQQATQAANAAAIAAGGPQVTQPQTGGLLAAMGANMAGALQGGVQAQYAAGGANQQASLARLAQQLADRSAQATGIRQRYNTTMQDELDRLYQRAFQQRTASDNSSLAHQQFGEQVRQNDINNSQQDAALAAQTNAQQQNLQLDWARLSAQQAAAAQRDDGAGRRARQKIIADARKRVEKLRTQMETGRGQGTQRYTYSLRSWDATANDGDGAWKTRKVSFEARNDAAAQQILRDQFGVQPPSYGDIVGGAVGFGQPEAQLVSTRTVAGAASQRRRYNDGEIFRETVQWLRSNGFQPQVAQQIARRIMGIQAPGPRQNGVPAREDGGPGGRR